MTTAAPARLHRVPARDSVPATVAQLRPGTMFQLFNDPSRIFVPLVNGALDISEADRVWCVVHNTTRPTDVIGTLVYIGKQEALRFVAPVNALHRYVEVEAGQ